MYLLDTNHCSRIIMNDVAVINRVAAAGEQHVATCVIVQGELVHMAQNSAQRQANLIYVQEFFRDIRVYGIDEATAHFYGQLKTDIVRHFGPKEKTKRRKIKTTRLGIGENDLWIAAVALQHNLTIVSADGDFQRMRAARPFALETWWQPPNVSS